MMDTTVGQVISPKGCAVLIGWLNALGKGLELLASTKKKAWLHWQGVGRCIQDLMFLSIGDRDLGLHSILTRGADE